ncbi:hypothetical protein F5X98DRAFT_382678 [Xylaria grammica]|nr:hypothetical protein F5X98DRAFT_382678 [Xylaria grammica]
MTDTRFRELEGAVCDVIQIIKQIPELADLRLAVVGGLALWHYLPDHRPTNNINFVTNIESLSFLEQKLLQHPHSPFVQSKHALAYHSPAGRVIQINISTPWLCPHLPEPAYLVCEIPYGRVPYVSLAELVAAKIDATRSKASSPVKRRQDADDARALIDYELARRPAGRRSAVFDENARAYRRRVVESMALRSPRQEMRVNEVPYPLYQAHSALQLPTLGI